MPATGASVNWPLWLTIWILGSSLIVLWDAGFVFMRPASMEGGDLFWIWSPYPNYYKTDRSYGDMENAFTVAQSYGNVIEVALCLVAFGLSVRSSYESKLQSIFLVLIVSVMTLWKTCVYWILEACSGWENTNNNEVYDVLVYIALPTSLWFIFPFLTTKWAVQKLTGLVLSHNKAKTH